MHSAGRRHVSNQERSNITSDLSKINQPDRERLASGNPAGIRSTDRTDRASGCETAVPYEHDCHLLRTRRIHSLEESDQRPQALLTRVHRAECVLVFRMCDGLTGAPCKRGSQLPKISTPRKCLILWGVIPTLFRSLSSFPCQRARAVAALGHSRPGTRSRSSVLSSGNRQSLRQ